MGLVSTAVSLQRLHTDTWSAAEGKLRLPFSSARLASAPPASPSAVCKRRRLRHSFPSTHRVSPLGGPPRLGDDRLGASHFPLPLFALPAQGSSMLASLLSWLLASLPEAVECPDQAISGWMSATFRPPFGAACANTSAGSHDMLCSSRDLFECGAGCLWLLKVTDMQHYMAHTAACQRMLLPGLASVRQQP